MIAAESGARGLSVDAIWHDLECGDYAEDMPLWEALAEEAGGPALDVGAGTGRVTLRLAARDVAIVALDTEEPLLRALARRAAGLPVETVLADARDFALGRRFRLILVPMQTLQLLGGCDGRTAFLRRALEHLEPGALLVAALADALDCFDDDRPDPPPPQACEIDGVVYASRLLEVRDEGGRAAIHRRREVIGPGDRSVSRDVVTRLDRVSAGEVAAEARALGFRNEPNLLIPETDEYLGSTVVVLRGP